MVFNPIRVILLSRDVWQDIFSCQKGRSTPDIKRVKDRTLLRTKNDQIHNVSSTEVQKPCITEYLL